MAFNRTLQHFTSSQDVISEWASGTVYALGQIVVDSNNLYRCIVPHTSGTFTTDLSAGKWVSISGSGSGVQLLWNEQPSLIFESLVDFVPGANLYERTKFQFQPSGQQGIEAIFRVPSGYTPGNNITLKFNHTNGVSGTYSFGVYIGLLIDEYTVSPSSSFSSSTYTASTSVKSSSVVIAPSGLIGVTAVGPGDLLWVFLTGALGTTGNVTVFGSSSEVTFT